MPRKELPQESKSQEAGQHALIAFQAVHPTSWRITPTDGDTDVGIDVQVQVVHKKLHRALFHAQIKGSRQSRQDGTSRFLSAKKEYYSVPLDTPTLNYYIRVKDAIMLVFADLTVDSSPRRCPVFYLWIHDELERLLDGKDEFDPEDQQERSFRVPVTNQLTEDLDVLGYLEKRLEKARALDGIYRGIQKHSEQPLDAASKVAGRFEAARIALDSLTCGKIEQPWVEAPEGSLAAKLRASSAYLASSNLGLAEDILAQIEDELDDATNHERAEYLYQKGAALEVVGDYAAAVAFHLKAREQATGHEKYEVAWAEASLSCDFLNKGLADEMLEFAQPLTGKKARFLKAKLLALLRRQEEALQQVPESEGKETILGRAMVYFITRDYKRTLEACEEALADSSAGRRNTFLFHLFKARVLFERGYSRADPRERVLFAGSSTMDPAIMRDAWSEILECWRLASELNYPREVELLVDISGFVGSYLGEVEVVYEHMKASARKHTARRSIQETLLELAQFLGDDKVVERQLERSPEGARKIVHQACLFYRQEEKNKLVDLALENLKILQTDESSKYAFVVETAAFCAHELVRRQDEARLLDSLKELPGWEEREAVFEFAVAIADNVLRLDDALQVLFEKFREGLRGQEICEQLFRRSNPHEESGAARIYEMQPALEEIRALSEEDTLKLCQAGATLKRWTLVLELCDSAEVRFGRKAIFKAIRAWSLDQLGDTPNALALLEEVVEADRFERHAFDAYAQIAARCGLLDKAKKALERLYERADNDREKGRFLLMILKIEMAIDPMSERLFEYWFRYGRINDREDEVDEGTYIMLLYHIEAACESQVTEKHKEEFFERIAEYTERFPESKIFRRISVPDSLRGRDLVRFLQKKTGLTEEILRNRKKLEDLIASGSVQVPYSLLPCFLTNVRDLLGLFDITKNTRKGNRQYELKIGAGKIDEERLGRIRRLVPIVDDVSLMLLSEVGLIHHLFVAFKEVAICRSTLVRLRTAAQSHFVSLYSDRARVLADELTVHVDQVRQIPLACESLDIDVEELQALAEILGETPFGYFSDDYYARLVVLEDEERARGVTTVDLIEILRLQGRLTEKEAAEKLGDICGWNVIGIPVRFVEILRALEGEVRENAEVADVVAIMKVNRLLLSFLEIMWDIRLGYDHCQRELVRFVSFLVVSARAKEFGSIRLESNVIVGFWSLWYQKVRVFIKGESGPLAYCARSLCDVALHALSSAQATKSEESVSRCIWRVHRRALEEILGEQMNREVEAQLIASVASLLPGIENLAARDAVVELLLFGLQDGSRDREVFNQTYLAARVKADRS